MYIPTFKYVIISVQPLEVHKSIKHLLLQYEIIFYNARYTNQTYLNFIDGAA